MKWCIVVDSSCDLSPQSLASETIRFAEVPFVISIGEEDYVDTASMDVNAMVDAMEACSTASRTSCPSPDAWYDHFIQADCSTSPVAKSTYPVKGVRVEISSSSCSSSARMVWKSLRWSMLPLPV